MTGSYAGTGGPASPGPAADRVADLNLRGAGGPIQSRAYWPAPTGAGVRPGLVVLFLRANGSRPPGSADRADELCRWLCAAAGLVVVAARCRAAFQDAVTTTEWAADHAAELAADPARLLVAGAGAGAGLAAAVALHARDHGWPPVTRQVLIRPADRPADRPLAGVAPATLVGAERYAARLRRAGVAVEEVRCHDLAGTLRDHLRNPAWNRREGKDHDSATHRLRSGRDQPDGCH